MLAINLPVSAHEIERFAAAELQSFLWQISGEEPRLGMGNEAIARHTFYLGDPLANGAEARLGEQARVMSHACQSWGHEEFAVCCLPGVTLLVGGSPVGVLYAVYSLLEEDLGVRWFYPDERDAVIPRLSPSELLSQLSHPVKRMEKPAFALRMISLGNFSIGQDRPPIDIEALISWAARRRINAFQLGWDEAGSAQIAAWSPLLHQRGIRLIVGDHHTYLKFLPPARYLADHPDWFALVNGERQAIDRWYGAQQFCLTNPKARETYFANIIRYLDETPGIDGIYLWPNDYGAWCQCPACSQGSVADNLLNLNNATARAVCAAGFAVEVIHPVYGNHIAPPARERPEGVSVAFCGWGRDFRYPWNDPHTNPEHRAFLKRWLDVGRESGTPVYLHSKLMRLRGIGYQLLPLAVVSQDMQHYGEIGLAGFDFHIAHVGWWTKGLNSYVVAKLAWNNQQDVDTLLEDYFQQYWGAAHAQVRAFYELIDRTFYHRQYYRVKQNYNLCHTKLEDAEPTFYNPQEAEFPAELVDYNARVLSMLARAEQILSASEGSALPLQTRVRLARLRTSFDFVRGEQESIRWLGEAVALIGQAQITSDTQVKQSLLSRASQAIEHVAQIESRLARMIEEDLAGQTGLIWDPTHHIDRLHLWQNSIAAAKA